MNEVQSISIFVASFILTFNKHNEFHLCKSVFNSANE